MLNDVLQYAPRSINKPLSPHCETLKVLFRSPMCLVWQMTLFSSEFFIFWIGTHALLSYFLMTALQKRPLIWAIRVHSRDFVWPLLILILQLLLLSSVLQAVLLLFETT